jgi:ribosomal protein S27AE
MVKALIDAQWEVQLNCECPKCGDFVNLLDVHDFWDANRELDIPEYNTTRSNNLDVECPECGCEFEVCCIW